MLFQHKNNNNNISRSDGHGIFGPGGSESSLGSAGLCTLFIGGTSGSNLKQLTCSLSLHCLEIVPAGGELSRGEAECLTESWMDHRTRHILSHFGQHLPKVQSSRLTPHALHRPVGEFVDLKPGLETSLSMFHHLPDAFGIILERYCYYCYYYDTAYYMVVG